MLRFMDDGRPLLPRPAFEDILEWIEANLDAPLTVERIARAAGLSPYHFSRLFTARTGRSVMAYVRHARLVRAARWLTADPARKLVDLAFDSGFESQEAFTRSFHRTFGASPGRLRRAYLAPSREILMSPSPLSASVAPRVEQLPALVRRDAFSVAGVSHRFEEATKLAIPGLWPRLLERLPLPGQAAGLATYGLVSSVDRADGSFDYMAAVELEPAAPTPPGLERKDLPANSYVVFRITLTGGPVHPQIQAAMQTVWGELIPRSGLTPLEAPDFELYDGTTAPEDPGAVIDYYVAVQA